MDLITDLQKWFAANCDGSWEHRYGIKIESCDNPDWIVKMDLVGTRLQSRRFAPIAENVDENEFQEGPQWLCCNVENDVWIGAGDETKLRIILRTFLEWAESIGA